MKRYSLFFMGGVFLMLSLGGWLFVHAHFLTEEKNTERAAKEEQDRQITQLIEARTAGYTTVQEDVFGNDDIVSVLLIGLDTRAGNTTSHCDAIQFVEINRKQNTVHITAVPRGTYAPLPGSGHIPSDYYVSNACAIGGIEYGIDQIQKILWKKADYVVFVGFSETLGMLRTLRLPSTETLQWLRHRQGYAIGEPQRARNHSTFLKEMLVRFIPSSSKSVDTGLQYLLYRMVDTDLPFSQVQQIIEVLSGMEFDEHPERIQLFMKPAYTVEDIAYDPDHIDEQLAKRLLPIVEWLPSGDYQGKSQETIQQELLTLIEQEIHHSDFVLWAYEHQLWLQIEDETLREQVHYQVLEQYLQSRSSVEEQQQLLADYIVEMEYRQLPLWKEEGKNLLEEYFQ